MIDNEWLSLGPVGYDLGRARARWPVSEPLWRTFVSTYRTIFPIDEDTLTFWSVVAGAASAWLRRDASPEALEPSLSVLRAIAPGA